METINGNDYMRDSQGRLCPVESVSDLDKMRDATVMELVAKARSLSGVLAAAKEEMLETIETFCQISAEQYDARVGGEKGNVSLVSFDGQYKVTRATQDNITFDERLGVAQSIISEVLRDLTDGSSSDLRALVESAFQVNKDGQVSTARILGLRRVKISHPRWADAMRALSDSIQPLYSKAFVRVYKRDGDGGWQPIPLDIAKA